MGATDGILQQQNRGRVLYEQRYCSRCVHGQSDKGCAVMTLHMLWNYDKSKEQKQGLDMLIPRDEDGHNMQCEMFHARAGQADPNQTKLDF